MITKIEDFFHKFQSSNTFALICCNSADIPQIFSNFAFGSYSDVVRNSSFFSIIKM